VVGALLRNQHSHSIDDTSTTKYSKFGLGIVKAGFTSSTMNPSSRSNNGFLDLPQEIILLILANLDSDYLYRLSFVCKRLHLLVLPLFFDLEGIIVANPEGPDVKTVVFGSAKSMKFLPVLRRSPFLSSINSIQVTFGGNVADRDRIIKDIRELGLLVSDLSKLQSISIDHITVFLMADDELVKALGELLSAAAEKSVKVFRVCDGEHLTFPSIEIDVPRLVVQSSVFRRPFSGLKRFLNLKVRHP
jgi:hypothetical protein